MGELPSSRRVEFGPLRFSTVTQHRYVGGCQMKTIPFLTELILFLFAGTIATYNLKKKVMPVKNCRSISKRDMKLNSATPKITVDPETYRVSKNGLRSPNFWCYWLISPLQVEANGVHCVVDPATKLPLSTNYMLF